MLAAGTQAARSSRVWSVRRCGIPQHHRFYFRSCTPTTRPVLDASIRRLVQVRLQSTVHEPAITSPIPPSPSPNYTGDKVPPKRSLPRRILGFVVIALVSTTLGFAMSAYPALQTANEILTPPTDEETLLLFNPTPEDSSYAINQHILSHPLTKVLEADAKFSAARPHLKIPPSLRPHNFTGGTLSGENMIPVPPLIFSTKDGSELVSIQYLGVALCGHPGIVHGGLLATLLDEGLARCCFAALPNKVGVTASLKIDYRKPCMAGQYVVLKAETTQVDGRKAWVKGRLETLPDEGEGEVLVEAEALFIEPRGAKSMARIYSTT